MRRLVVISPKGEFFDRPLGENYKHAIVLKEFLDEQNIPYNNDTNNVHKLCLDLSRKGYWLFIDCDDTSLMYIGRNITAEQFIWYSDNIEYIDQMNVISIASWEDPEYESGYDVIEADNSRFNSLRKKIKDLVIRKNRSHKKSLFGFFRRAK